MVLFCCFVFGGVVAVGVAIDAYDHEVWHRGSDGDRVVLLFDVWHPELVQGEREAIVRMFEDAKEKGWLKEFES